MQVATIAGEVGQELHGLGALAKKLASEISLRDVRTGRWFSKLLTQYVAYWEARHPTHAASTLSAAERSAAAAALIERAARFSALAGAGSASMVTVASLTTAETGGFAGPLMLPVAAASMVSEMVGRSLIHLNLALEIADLYGVRFPTGREGELVRLYALAFRAEQHETETDPGRGLVERVVRLQETGELGKMVATRMVGETLLRNVVPYADIVISSISNWRLTHEVGRYVQGYVSRRLELDAAVDAVDKCAHDCVDLLLEGMWFIFISDGRLTGIETALLAHMLRRQGAQGITPRFVSDEADWCERLRNVPEDPELRRAFLRALGAIAGSDGRVSALEGAVLRSAARALGQALPETQPAA
jgi:tellurite resistance protein